MLLDNISDVLVSIIVPVYNAERYLEQCLESLIKQTLSDIEIIIIDDGSTDNSSNICNLYAMKDQRIFYYHKENEGLAAARQDGIDKSKGKYIGFVDSDDWVEPDMYKKMVEAAEDNNADIVFCNCYFDDYDKDRIHLAPGVYNRKKIECDILPRTLAGISEKGNNSVVRWSNCLRIYRLELLKNNGIKFDRRFRRSQDLQLTFESTLVAQNYVSLNNEYLYHNRTFDNANSLSRGYTKHYWALIRPLIDVLYEKVHLYKKQDLSNQMHLCVFFFLATGVKNEYENKNDSIIGRISKLNQIAKDDIIIKVLPFIEYDRLSKYYQAIYKGLCTQRGILIYYYYFAMEFKNNRIMPLVRKILNNKYVEKVYIKLIKQ